MADEFLIELAALLKKYKATITAEDHYLGYPGCGQDIRMTVDIASSYNEDGDCLQEGREINLGSYFNGT